MTTFPIKASLLAASIFCFSLTSPISAAPQEDYEGAKESIKIAIKQMPPLKRDYATLRIEDQMGVVRAHFKDENGRTIKKTREAWFLESEWTEARTNPENPMYSFALNRHLSFKPIR